MLAFHLHELAKVLFQTVEAESTEYTRVPGKHASEEAVQELVSVNASSRDFTRPLGATQRRCIVSTCHLQNIFMADAFVRGMNLRSLHGTERMREIILCGTWMFPAFWRKFLFEFTLFFLEVLLETRSLSLDKRQSHGPGHKSTVVIRESIHVVTPNSNFSFK